MCFQSLFRYLLKVFCVLIHSIYRRRKEQSKQKIIIFKKSLICLKFVQIVHLFNVFSKLVQYWYNSQCIYIEYNLLLYQYLIKSVTQLVNDKNVTNFCNTSDIFTIVRHEPCHPHAYIYTQNARNEYFQLLTTLFFVYVYTKSIPILFVNHNLR